MKGKEFLIIQKPNSTGILLKGAIRKLTIKNTDPNLRLAWNKINNFINNNKISIFDFDIHAIRKLSSKDSLTELYNVNFANSQTKNETSLICSKKTIITSYDG